SIGDGAVLSHLSAAAQWGLLEDRGGRTHVTVARRPRSGKTVSAHAVRRLPHEDWTVNNGIPVTTVPRTVLDLAGMTTRDVSAAALRRAVSQALLLDRANLGRLREQIARDRSRPGVARLAKLLEAGAAPTRSVLEDRLLALVRAAKLPEPS